MNEDDKDHATMVAQSVERLNKVVMDACRAGLEVRIDTTQLNCLGIGQVSVLHYHVARTVKRG